MYRLCQILRRGNLMHMKFSFSPIRFIHRHQAKYSLCTDFFFLLTAILLFVLMDKLFQLVNRYHA